jgi:hypothetical protein
MSVVLPGSGRYDENPVRLLARYGTADELARDVSDQLPRGGLVVRTAVPAGLQLFAAVEVAVECEDHVIVVAGQVLQIFPGIGVAVGLDRPARERIEGLAGGSRAALPPVTTPAGARGDDAAAAGGVGRGTADIDLTVAARLARGTSSADEMLAAPSTSPAAPGAASDEAGEPRRLATGSNAAIDRIQLALRGDRDQRMEILRGKNRALHQYVLRNPGLTVEEIGVIARMATVAPEVLTQIADRRDWGQRPEIAMALVRNVATPIPVAIRLVDHVSVNDLRMLAKDARIREPVQRAARKKLLS